MKRWLLVLITWWQERKLCPGCRHTKALHDPIEGCLHTAEPGSDGYWCDCKEGVK